MNKWVCGLLASSLLVFPICGACASLEDMARPMHEMKAESWAEVISCDTSLVSLINTKNIHFDKEQNRLYFWQKNVHREILNNPKITRGGNIQKVVVDLDKMVVGYEYSDSWDTKTDRISYSFVKKEKDIEFEPILPGTYQEGYINKALEVAKLPQIPTPHTYEYIGEGAWPAGSELPRGVKNRIVEMYLCTNWYIKDCREYTWRFYITEIYNDELVNGQTERYEWCTIPVYVNFKAHTISFKNLDDIHKTYEAGLPHAVYEDIFKVLKAKNDMPNEGKSGL